MAFCVLVKEQKSVSIQITKKMEPRWVGGFSTQIIF